MPLWAMESPLGSVLDRAPGPATLTDLRWALAQAIWSVPLVAPALLPVDLALGPKLGRAGMWLSAPELAPGLDPWWETA